MASGQPLEGRAGFLQQSAGLGPNSNVPAATYDEQLSETFAQSVTSLAYNVTAVAQTDTYGYGPAYLVNGLTTAGYWYQVGLSYDWPYLNGGYVSGFSLNYETFNSAGVSIYPAQGGGLMPFSGAVNSGDTVLLELYFGGGNVYMYGKDLSTGATASTSFNEEGSTTFTGLGSPLNSNGFFTGLMTEWWHVSPSYSNEKEVLYTDTGSALSSAYFWADEWIPGTNNVLFSVGSSLQTFSNPHQLLSFSTNGLTGYADAYRFITGALTTSTTSITLSAAGQSAPLSTSNEFKVTYQLNSVNLTIYYTGSTLALSTDMGTYVWLSPYTTASSSSEEWVFASPLVKLGVPAGDSIDLYYYDLLAQPLSYSVVGGGSPSVPSIIYATAPSTYSTSNSLYQTSVPLQPSSQTIWVVRGSLVSVPASILASQTERWAPPVSTWTVTAPSQVGPTINYYHQYYDTLSYQISGGGSGFGQPSITCQTLGSAQSEQVGTAAWLDAGSSCTYSSTLAGSTQNERWATQAGSTSITGAGTVSPTYYNQYSATVSYQVSGGGSPSAPTFTGTSFGSTFSMTLSSTNTVSWLDAGSPYALSNPLPGSSSTERWSAMAQTSGTLNGPTSISATFYHQFLLTASYALIGGGTPIPPILSYASFGSSALAQLTNNLQLFWADGGSQYSTPQTLTGSSSTERWYILAGSGTVQAPVALSFNYYHQFLLTTSGGGLTSRWYNSSSTAQVSAPGVYGRASGSGQRIASYSIDGASPTTIQPTAGTVLISILMNSAHTLSINSVQQYQVNLDTSATSALSSITSPTVSGDNYWYDQGTPVSLTLNGVWNRSGGTGDRLASYSLNGVSMAVATTGPVNVLSGPLSSPETVLGAIIAQYRLTTSTGSVASMTVPAITGDAGWYDSGTQVAVTYLYSWNNTSGQSRVNALSYSIGSKTTTLNRSGSGTFPVQLTITAPESVAIGSVKQYSLAVSGGHGVSLSRISPTADSFYDAGTSLTATTDYTWGLTNDDVRQNLLSFTLNSATTNVTRESAGNFTTPAIPFTGAQTLMFNAVTQDLVTLQFKDSTGTNAIVPTSVQYPAERSYNHHPDAFRSVAGQWHQVPGLLCRVGEHRREAYDPDRLHCERATEPDYPGQGVQREARDHRLPWACHLGGEGVHNPRERNDDNFDHREQRLADAPGDTDRHIHGHGLVPRYYEHDQRERGIGGLGASQDIC